MADFYADLVVLVAPAGHRDTRKFTGSRFTVPTRIAGLPGATGNHPVVPHGRVRNSTVIAGSAYWASAPSADGL